MISAILLFGSTSQAGVVINEFFANPDGGDTGFEWVELYNTGPGAMGLNGWVLSSATSSFSNTGADFTGVTIPEGGYLLVGGANVVGVDVLMTGSLGNASSSGDALMLEDDGGGVQDVVVYGPNNDDAFEDESFSVVTSLAPIADAESTGRSPNGADTDASGDDFILFATPTPGAANGAGVPTPPPVECDAVVGTSVVINELLSDPAGADTDAEWVELYNAGSGAVDVSGWQIASGTSDFSTAGTIPANTTIAAGGFLVVGQSTVSSGAGFAHVVAEGFSLGNAGANADAVRVEDCDGGVADTVVYGDNSDATWDDDLGNPATGAPVPGSGETIGRFPDGADTNSSSIDFMVLTPTPGVANDDGPVIPTLPEVDCDSEDVSTVVINELLPDPSGADAGMEWVELLNTGSQTLDVAGWVVAAGTSTFNSRGTLPAGTTLAPGQHLQIGNGPEGGVAVQAPGFSLGNASSSADGVRIEDCRGNVADTVIYGEENTDEWLDDLGNPASLAPKPAGGQSIGRIPDGSDTNSSSIDFVVLQPNPGLANDAEPPDCGGFNSGLVINEVFSDPEGADTGAEWVELYHAGSVAIDASGWAVEAAGSDSWETKHVFEDGTRISPGDYIVVGGEFVTEATVPLAGSLGNGTGGDGLRVVDCSGASSDVVVYGGVNDDGVIDETGSAATTVAPKPPSGGSIQRVMDGFDTGDDATDFVISEMPTPGRANPEVEPVICSPDEGSVRINELVPDPDGSDDGLEWFELYNSGSAPQDLDGWMFSAGTSNYDNRGIVLPGDVTIQPGEFLVVGGGFVPEVDVELDFSLGNGTNSRDGLRMFDCDGAVVDTVVYGVVDEEDPDADVVDDEGRLVEPYGDPGSAQSLSRVEDGVDTNDAADWQVSRPTPGESNTAQLATPPDDDEPRGCGGGGGGPAGEGPGADAGGEAPQSGCATAPSPWTGSLLLALLIAGRRRR